jgi:hypothetical protein
MFLNVSAVAYAEESKVKTAIYLGSTDPISRAPGTEVEYRVSKQADGRINYVGPVGFTFDPNSFAFETTFDGFVFKQKSSSEGPHDVVGDSWKGEYNLAPNQDCQTGSVTYDAKVKEVGSTNIQISGVEIKTDTVTVVIDFLWRRCEYMGSAKRVVTYSKDNELLLSSVYYIYAYGSLRGGNKLSLKEVK